MKLELFNNEAAKIWKRISDSEEKVSDLLQLEIELYKKLLIFFQIGESCYHIFNFQQVRFDFVSEEVTGVFGYSRYAFTPEQLLENIHPEDRGWFLNCQETAGQFLQGLSPDKQMKYKLRMDYRIKKQDGEYIRVMLQSVVIQNDDAGSVLRTLIVHTDITHLKKDGRPVMSYIGMDGEPSYLDVDVKNHFKEESHLLTKREKEILYLLAEGKASKEIAELLYISKNTVDSHRKSLLRKTGSAGTVELINKTIRDGLV
ncbi:PAS fold-containing protein [Mucilaginibacter gossypiicola]|uniref:PAS fold-containing protein n=1 Tax=Mucilaginibacter gossypiicola TaxID=551995 RepID=A0A1H8BAU8_9SPHI|nr:LuxR C-terminal-related transcriptional regulator [Mucilaginibacter gossypiicola]SEM79138.1 PAS fold-containing protein [Mucilaginibacter gossypiicola]